MTTKTSDRHWFQNPSSLIYICGMVSSLVLGQALAHEDYSSSREEVAGKLIPLDTLPLKTFTHYLTKLASDTSSYNFMVETDESMDGVFITLGKFIFKSRFNDNPNHSTCEFYNITMYYPNGEIQHVCKNSKYNPRVYYEWKGVGRITVEIEFLQPDSSKTSEFTILRLEGPQGKEIPDSAIGFVVFTSYKDCSNNSNFNGIELRSCSKSNEEKCIAKELFCDGVINCDSRVTLEDRKSYDESEGVGCSYWNWKSGTASSVEVPIVIGFGVISVVVALVTTLKRMIGKRMATGIPWKPFA